MRVCFATSECVPYVKTGGLADVSGALPKALADLGCEVKVVLPLYQSIDTLRHGLQFSEDLYEVPVQIGGETVRFNAWYGRLPGSQVDVHFIDCPRYYHRPSIYDGSQADEAERFILLQHAAFKIMQRYAWKPDIVHCNDWQTGLMPAYLRTVYGWDDLFRDAASVFTLHNMAYQGRFNDGKLYPAGLDRSGFYAGGPYELEGSFSFMKTGLVHANAVSAVSPTYAWEIQQPEHGYGLDGVLRSRRDALYGIVNGIDPNEWNPTLDPHIEQPYDVHSLDQKEANKRAVLADLGLPYEAGRPVVGVVSRLTGQKGFDLLQPLLQPLVEQHGVQFVVLGSGEPHLEDFFRWAAGAFPDRVGVYVGYNNALAHRIEAGADLFLMPSRFEPCGLNQMYSLAYGTVPVVRKTGGLADTVHDVHEYYGQGNGFSFVDYTAHALWTTMMRALDLYRQPDVWRGIQQRGMHDDFSWQASAERYLHMYQETLHRYHGR